MTTITAVPDPTTSQIVVTVSGASDPAEIVRVDSSGNTLPIRDGDPAVLVAGATICHDYEAPLDEPVVYKVVAPGNFNTVHATSAAKTLVSNGKIWIKHPGHPDLNIAPTLEPMTNPLTYTTTQGTFQIIGRKNPVVITSQRSDLTGGIIVYTRTLPERRAMLNLLDDGAVLLFQTPGEYDLGSTYVAVGEVTESWVVDDGRDPAREWTLALTAVDRPVGIESAGVGNSWADVVNDYPSWLLVTARGSWAELIRHVSPIPDSIPTGPVAGPPVA